MVIDAWLTDASTTLKDAGIPSPRLDAEVILAYVLGTDRTWLITHGDKPLDASSTSHANKLIRQRQQRQPIAYLTGRKEFYGRQFQVTADTLIPRPETEALVEMARELQLTGRAIDIGTGSGCLGITVALELPHITMTLSDVSEQALSVARANASLLEAPIESFVTSDLLGHWQDAASPQFDVIIANLPYVSRDWEVSPETEREPDLALYADNHGRALMERLLPQAAVLLPAGGYVILEADPEQHDPLTAQAATLGFSMIASRDYALCLKRAS